MVVGDKPDRVGTLFRRSAIIDTRGERIITETQTRLPSGAGSRDAATTLSEFFETSETHAYQQYNNADRHHTRTRGKRYKARRRSRVVGEGESLGLKNACTRYPVVIRQRRDNIFFGLYVSLRPTPFVPLQNV